MLPVTQTPTATPTASLHFAHVMAFEAPLMRVKVETLATAPFPIATAVTDSAKVAGAAWAELARIAPAMIAVVELTPRLVK